MPARETRPTTTPALSESQSKMERRLQFDITLDGFTLTGEAADVRHITGWTVLGGSTAS